MRLPRRSGMARLIRTTTVVCLLLLASACQGHDNGSIGLPSSPSPSASPGSAVSARARANVTEQPTPALRSPTDIPATTTCGEYGLFAETATGYTYLLDCAAGTQLPVPTVRLAVGSVLQVAGSDSKNARLFVGSGQSVIRLDGLTMTGLRPGSATVSTRGLSCSMNYNPQPDTCPLMRVLVS